MTKGVTGTGNMGRYSLKKGQYSVRCTKRLVGRNARDGDQGKRMDESWQTSLPPGKRKKKEAGVRVKPVVEE